jgi:hypothetical protein
MPPRSKAWSEAEYVEPFPGPAPLSSSDERGTALLGSLFNPARPPAGYDSLIHAREQGKPLVYPAANSSAAQCSQDAFVLALPDLAGLSETVDRSHVYSFVDALPCDVVRNDVSVAWGSSLAAATPARLTGSALRGWVSSGHSVHLSTLNLDCPAVRHLCWAVDAGWPGNGCCVAHFIMSKGAAMPAHRRGEDIIIIALDGKWRVSARASCGGTRQRVEPTGAIVDWYPQPVQTVKPFPFPGAQAFGLDAQSPGRRPACYIPSTHAFDLHAVADNSLCLLLTLPQPLDGSDVVQKLAVAMLQREPGAFGTDLFPHVGPTRREALARRLELTAAAIRDTGQADMAEALDAATPAGEMLSFYRFDLAAWYAGRNFLDLETMLAKSGGIVHIPNFLPEELAKRCSAILESTAPCDWQENSGSHPPHHFHSSTSFPYSTPIRNMLARLVPHRRAVVSAACYTEGDGIAPHDDKAHRTILGQVHSRTIAVVLHLTPYTWPEARNDEMGGCFVDHVTGKQYAPQFNSLVAFTVPRQHEVTAVQAAFPGKRLSLFGWFLEPGEKYSIDIDLTEEGPTPRKKTRR